MTLFTNVLFDVASPGAERPIKKIKDFSQCGN